MLLYLSFRRYGEDDIEPEKNIEIKERRKKKESLRFLIESTRQPSLLTQIYMEYSEYYSRKMFLLQYSLEVKMDERIRLEKTLKVKDILVYSRSKNIS